MAGIRIVCPNCNRNFYHDQYQLCPNCGWDRFDVDGNLKFFEQALENAKARIDDLESRLEMVPGPAFEDLSSLNVGQLRPMARDLGVDRWYQLNKNNLVKAIQEQLVA